MKIKNNMFILILLFFWMAQAQAQSNKSQYFQTIRGRVIDHESKQALIGANIVILKSNPFKGTASDMDGRFVLNQIPIGRLSLHISCLGYEAKTISNIEVGSAKEVVLEIELLESLTQINEIKVYPKARSTKP